MRFLWESPLPEASHKTCGKFVSGAKVLAAVPQPKEFMRIDLKLAGPGRGFQQTLKYRDLSRNGESHYFLHN